MGTAPAPGSDGRTRFIEANTSPANPPHVPEISLHLADEAHDLWHRTEEELGEMGLPPPFWAFAWAGGQGLARYILDHPETVAGRQVLDLATGSGLVAIACAMSGAAHVTANDIDPWSEAALALNTRLNAVSLNWCGADLLAEFCQSGALPASAAGAQVVLAGDVFYDRELAAAALPFLLACAQEGKTVLAGDPGRAYLPRENLELMAEYSVPVTRAIEDSEVKRTKVWSVRPGN